MPSTSLDIFSLSAMAASSGEISPSNRLSIGGWLIICRACALGRGYEVSRDSCVYSEYNQALTLTLAGQPSIGAKIPQWATYM